METRHDPAMLGSRFERRPLDAYFTQTWITQALMDHYAFDGPVWEPAAGKGDMANQIGENGYLIGRTDIVFDDGAGIEELDFLTQHKMLWWDAEICLRCRAIITNPPFDKADAFIAHAFKLRPLQIAMLLRHDFDCARKRLWMWSDPVMPFAMKLTLTKRPRWDWWERDKPLASPRHNFAWFIWDRRHKGPPILAHHLEEG